MTNREVISDMDDLTLVKWIFTDCQTIANSFTYGEKGLVNWFKQEAPDSTYKWIDQMIFERYDKK